MNNCINRFTRHGWKNYKRNNLHFIFQSATNPWMEPLFRDNIAKIIKKLKLSYFYYLYHRLRFFFICKPIIPTSLEYVVTTHCTMRCKECNTFIPYFSKDSQLKPVAFEQFKHDIDTLLKSVDFIYALGFVGGEPLLAKDLAKMINYAATKKQIRHIFIATNCTILPSEDLIEALKHQKVSVQLSDYKNVKFLNKITSKFDTFKSILLKNNIHFNALHNLAEAKFMNMPSVYKDSQPKEAQKTFDSCFGRFCNMLCDGILTQCTISVYIARNKELSDDICHELIDIRKSTPDELTNKIIQFYAKDYSAFCHYCHWNPIPQFSPCGEQVERGKSHE